MSLARPAPAQAPRTWFHPTPPREKTARERDDDNALIAWQLALLLGFPLLIATWVVTHALVRALRLRWWWALVPSVVGVVWVLAIGPARALDQYVAVYRGLWAQLSTGPGAVALRSGWGPRLWALAPLSLSGGGVAAAVSRLVVEVRRPTWRTQNDRPSSRWQRHRAAQRSRRVPADHIRLGANQVGETVAVSPAELEGHALIVGATGSGKTTTVLHLADGVIRQGHALVMVDLKGDPSVVARLRELASQEGRPFFAWGLQGPTRWNPVAAGDATRLKDKLIAGETFTEPHYKRVGERYLQLVFTALHAAGVTPSLAEVVELLHPAALVRLARDLPAPLGERLRAFADEVRTSPDQQSAVAGLRNRLALVTESVAGPWLAPGDGPTLDLLDAVRERAVVVFSLPSATYPGMAALLGAMVLVDLEVAAGQLQQQATHAPVYVVVDEFSALEGTHLLGLLARGRGAGMSVWLATQELADLAAADPAFVDQVLGNTNLKLAHRVDVPESAERLAAIAGTDRVWEETLQISHASPLALREARGAATGLGSLRAVDHFRVHPNTFKELPRGRAVLIGKSPRHRIDIVDIRPAHASGQER